MARIPLQVGTRSLDTGSVVQYPSGSPVGAAVANFGADLQNVASRLQQKQEQKDNFDLSIRENEFAADLSRIEDEAVQNAAADGSGLHDSVYGQIDPVTKQAVKPGSFDQVFESYLQRVPESKRQEFQAKRDVYRLRGSARLAQQQYASEQAYYKVEIQKTQNDITTAMAMADPNDDQTFDTFKQQGLDIIEKSGLPALEKDVARENWLANADETLFKTKLAKDPAFAEQARSALGLAPPAKVDVPALAPDVGSRATQAMGFFMKKGYSQVQAAGIVGNLIQESNLRPSGAVGDNGTAFGVAQWRGERLNRLKRFASANGRSWEDFETQLAFIDLELNDSERTAGGKLRAAKTVEEATAAFIGYERPKGWRHDNPSGGHGWTNRLGHAASIAGVEVDLSGPGADPRFANIPLGRRLVLANQADVQVAETQRIQLATQKAEYASYKDALELQVVQGQIKDERLISADPTLNDGDKATLIRSFRSQNETALQVQTDLTALTGNSLALDPYASKDKTRADNLYSAATQGLSNDQSAAIASAIIQQTGVVPQPVVNDIRRGLTSTSLPDVVSAAQAAQRISSYDPAVLARRDGGGDVQKAADDFSYYVNKLNMEPEEAAQRLIDSRNPEKQFTRKALEPAAKEFVKAVETEDLAAVFDESSLPFNDPQLGVNPAQEAGIKAEFIAIAEDQFYQSNGDPEIAKNRAIEQMKRLYGVTEIGGAKTVMKHPPEKYWPRLPEAGFLGFEGDAFGYAKKQLQDDIKAFGTEIEDGSISLVTTPETDAMVKRGELPAYAVLYKDANGVYQTIPGKLWRPDVNPEQVLAKAAEEQAAQQARLDLARARQEDDRYFAEQQALPDGGRERALDEYLAGPPQLPGPISAEPPQTDPTLQDRLDERQDELFQNAPQTGGGGGF